MSTQSETNKGEPRRLTVLLVDDRRENLSVLVDVLDRAGLRVLVAEDGEAGVQQAQRALPDVILLDVRMPILDGYGACRQLKNDDRTRDIPVIFVTAKGETLDRVRGLAAGGVDHVTKPFRPEEVLARVVVHAKLSRQERAIRRARAALTTTLVEKPNATNDELKSAIAAALGELTRGDGELTPR